MPVKIQFESLTVAERLDALRKTIKANEGLTMREVAAALGRSESHIKTICAKNGWLVRQFSAEKRNHLNLLVNPKTLALCRKQ